VLGFSNHVIWRCPTSGIVAHYSRWISGNHLEVGVGTGYYLDHCRWPVEQPRVGLLDLHPDPLRTAGARLARFRLESYRADVLEPLAVRAEPFDSVALTYLLHCLPAEPLQKTAVIDNLRPLLAPGARVFGATIVSDPALHNPASRVVMAAFNRAGVFSNTDDSAALLAEGLEQHLDELHVAVTGAVALFSGRLR
jgi:2-polyprenyl-3-methyl-5-hydroxy-6-metoxy-1,4-benzoquinol methylase